MYLQYVRVTFNMYIFLLDDELMLENTLLLLQTYIPRWLLNIELLLKMIHI